MLRFLTVGLLLVSSLALAAKPYRGGAAATAHPAGAAAAVAMLDQKGNAFDAVVAAAFTMAVVGPYHSGLGGGGFAVGWQVKDQTAFALDFREVAPAKATPELYLKDGVKNGELSRDGPLSVAVPGAVMGYLELLSKHGRLTRAQVLKPAIDAAKKGFVVTPKYLVMLAEREACLKNDPEASKQFVHPELGSIITQPELAKTLEAIARDGNKAFYAGRVARAIESATNGAVTQADLAAYKTRDRAPLIGSYRGHRIVTMPPPSAGGLVVLSVLGALERAGPDGLASRQVSVLHTYIEALRRSYAERAQFLGDPAFVEVPLERLSSAAHFDETYASIDKAHATRSSSLLPPKSAAPDAGPGQHTSQMSVIDKDGNAVALTSTVNYWFGSCIVAKGTGVLLNDEMDDFSIGGPNVYGLVTGAPNAIAPGKVPLSSMSPALVFQKDRPTDILLAVGAAGGPRIPTSTLQVISNVVDGKMNVERAVAFGRIHHQWLPDEVLVEPFALDPSTMKALTDMGHVLKAPKEGLADVEAVMVDPLSGTRQASADQRNEGGTAGQQ